jgi:hypothetical protein
LLPWLGFMMSGAAGLVWLSYWLATRGYGAAHERESETAEPVDMTRFGEREHAQLHGWIRTMTGTVLVAGVLVLILLTALIILGAELLMPEGLLPEGPAVTAVLSRLLGEVWGAWGRWLMIAASFFAFWSTIIANLDGWGRMLGQASVVLAKRVDAGERWTSLPTYRWIYIVGLMGLVPALLAALVPEPYRFLQIAGIIEAIQIPFVALVVLYLNRRELPEPLRPSLLTSLFMTIAGLFFLAFAGYYVYAQLR